jgi:hypothetical protein
MSEKLKVLASLIALSGLNLVKHLGAYSAKEPNCMKLTEQGDGT